MKRSKKDALKNLLCLGVISTLLLGCADNQARIAARAKLLEDLRQAVDLNGRDTPDLEEGEVAPTLVGINLKGQPLSMESHKGKVILVSFLGET